MEHKNINRDLSHKLHEIVVDVLSNEQIFVMIHDILMEIWAIRRSAFFVLI